MLVIQTSLYFILFHRFVKRNMIGPKTPSICILLYSNKVCELCVHVRKIARNMEIKKREGHFQSDLLFYGVLVGVGVLDGVAVGVGVFVSVGVDVALPGFGVSVGVGVLVGVANLLS